MNNIDKEKIKQIANEVLAENYISQPPVPVVELAKNYGYEVKEIDLPPNIAGFVDPKNHTIFLNILDSDTRKAFTIAHEIGHIKMHSEDLEKNPDIGILYRRPLGEKNSEPKESAANYFAACLLVPLEMLEKVKEKYGNLINNNLELLSALFGVSPEVIGYRLQDLKNGSKA